jgi:hypothetical protein
MKVRFTYLLIASLFLVLSACSNTRLDNRLVKKWTLVKVDGYGPDKDQVLGINTVFFDLKEDETFEGRWYDQNNMTDFIDLKGKWLSTQYDDKIELFLFYGPNQKKSISFNIATVEGNDMTMRISEIDYFFKAK